jgi:drug/metabolite transporter (DMT)-like permease
MDNGGPKSVLLGVVLALFGAAGQAAGYVLTKRPLDHVPAISGSLVRMLAASLGIWLIGAWQLGRARARGEASPLAAGLRHPSGLALAAGGAFCGPVLGVWLSLIANQSTKVGIAATLMALSPILVIPLAMVIRKERPTWLEVVGTFVAIGGVALLLWPE